MLALRFAENKLNVDEIARPMADGECLVKVLKSGICSTDLQIIRGYAGFSGTIGHEFVGVVEEAHGRPDLKGKRVVGEINVGCGRCELCLAGDPRHCGERTVLGIKGRDGAHAEYLALPAENLLEVPDEVTDEEAVFCEPLAAAVGITEQVEIGETTRVAVIGDGELGLLCSFAMRLRSASTILIGRHSEKLALAGSRDIEGILSTEIDTLSGHFDVVIEASGSESGFAAALDLVRPRGKIVLKSTFQGNPTWEAWRVVVDEITVVGSRCGRFDAALELLKKRRIRVGDLIRDEFRLADGLSAIARASERGVLKVILDMSG